MYILGINAFHGDSSAAIIKDGRLLAAVEEERFTRQKHWAGLPVHAIRFCLQFAGLDIKEIRHIAINSDNNAHKWKKVIHVLRSLPSPGLLIEKLTTRASRQGVLSRISEHLGQNLDHVLLHPVEHHYAHLASAYYPSSYDSAVVVSVDGFGDFSSAAWGVGNGEKLEATGYCHFPHSLGIFYEAVTQYLGFPNYGDEYKMMGLASYGKPVYLPEFRQILSVNRDGLYTLDLRYFKHHRQSSLLPSQDGTPRFSKHYTQNLTSLLGPERQDQESIGERHQNIAASAQAIYEEVLWSFLNTLHQKNPISNLALAGGCAMNSVANGKIKSNTPFENVFVQPAAGDAGGAVGAALAAYLKMGGRLAQPVMPDAYLGPEYPEKEIQRLLANRHQELTENDCSTEKRDEEYLTKSVAQLISEGKVVGWFQGRMEWGARALGNRSILADPRRDDMQEVLNLKIKRRESFRPFAPSILREKVKDWFEQEDDVPFMEKVYPILESKHSEVPAVTHIDGTGRLQTVSQSSNPRYYRLISSFFELTGVPMLLNTSFNENEPIVCTPTQALDCFLRTNMDVLVLGNIVVHRPL